MLMDKTKNNHNPSDDKNDCQRNNGEDWLQFITEYVDYKYDRKQNSEQPSGAVTERPKK